MVEEKTGLTPRLLIIQAHDQGFHEGTKARKPARSLPGSSPNTGLGHGHVMAMVHVIENGAHISSKHVGSSGSHRDASDMLWLDGKATKPCFSPGSGGAHSGREALVS